MKVFNTHDAFNRYMEVGRPRYTSEFSMEDQPHEIIIHRILKRDIPTWEVLKVYFNRSVLLISTTMLPEAWRYGKCYESGDYTVELGDITYDDN